MQRVGRIVLACNSKSCGQMCAGEQECELQTTTTINCCTTGDCCSTHRRLPQDKLKAVLLRCKATVSKLPRGCAGACAWGVGGKARLLPPKCMCEQSTSRAARGMHVRCCAWPAPMVHANLDVASGCTCTFWRAAAAATGAHPIGPRSRAMTPVKAAAG